MAFLRVWTVLLALLVAAAVGLATLVPRSAHNELLEERARRLEYARDSVHLLLKVNARTWMDTVRQIAEDGTIADALTDAGHVTAATSGAGLGATASPPLPQPLLKARAILQPRLESFNRELKAELLWAVDGAGRIIAQVGSASMAGEVGIDLNDPAPAIAPVVSGIPVVEAALRGYDVADTWGIDGKLYRIAATPVFSRNNDHYIGALVLADRVDDDLARQLSRMLDVDVAFLVDGQVIATSLGSSTLPTLAVYVERYRKAIQEAGRTRALAAELDNGRQYQLAFAKVSGEAQERRATYAVLKETPSAKGLIAFVQAGAGGALVRSGSLLALMLVIAVALTALGWTVVHLDGVRPLRRLIGELQAVERRELSRIREERFSLLWRVLARSVQTLARRTPARNSNSLANRTANAVARDRADTPSGANRPLSRTVPPPPGGSPSMRLAATSSPAPAVNTPSQPGRRSGTNPIAPPVGSNSGASEHLSSPGAGLSMGGGEGEGEVTERPNRDAEATKAAIPNSRPNIEGMPAETTEPRGPFPEFPGDERTQRTPPPVAVPHVPERRPTGPTPIAAPPPVVTPVGLPVSNRATGPVAVPFNNQPASPPNPFNGPMGGVPPSPFNGPMGVAPPSPFNVPAAGAPMPVAPSLMDDAAYFRQVFEEFLVVRKRCGELVDSMSYERFIERLRDNRDALMRQHQCRGVKFQVYVKDGKAALRATPIR